MRKKTEPKSYLDTVVHSRDRAVEAMISLYNLDLPCYGRLAGGFTECNENDLCDSCKAIQIIHSILEVENKIPE